MKKIIALPIAASILFTTVGTANATQSTPTIPPLVEGTAPQKTVKQDIKYTAEGNKVVSFSVEYPRDPKASIAVKPKQKVDSFTFTKDGDIFENGVKLDLTKYASEQFYAQKPTLQSGGSSWLTYYDEYSPGYFEMYGYPDANFFMDYSIGSKLSAYSNYTFKVSSFITYATDVANQRAGIVQNGAALMTTLGITVLTAATVIGALGGAGTAAVLAYNIYDDSNSGHASMKNAYSVLQSY
ncbi:hypothetical protein [Tumebacillus flagellatus]|uniref:Cohesin domain-containing protein n=1 Tax=Tumebacillus flagellatus TaxID=1157490 RepID=A0A074LJP2_9BACL|nr:hypothetical protein [Tumebacillus flagellatus]KEO80825.1 hypothetical protein EL26_24210 [Tumebacillus flagellatus]